MIFFIVYLTNAILTFSPIIIYVFFPKTAERLSKHAISDRPMYAQITRGESYNFNQEPVSGHMTHADSTYNNVTDALIC